MSLSGKVALVTGGSRGIGKAIVQRLAQAGAKVAFVYHSNAAAADALVHELKAEGHQVMAYQADASNKVEADKIVEDVVDKWSGVYVLVNNAGIIKDGLLATMSAEQWQAVINTNLNSVFNFSQAVTRPMMSARQGRIINISSVAANFGNSGQANYAASKGGIEGFTRCLANELGRRGITVNAIAPGFIATDMTEAIRNAAEETITKQIPARRLGKPGDIANAVLFFASEGASYVTGNVLTIDGGLTLGAGL
ncbi:MAG TPA: 3-oxoacyl-[acyl-carrier-protein] reductase [Planctomycetaceae bacterium]|nr:3-oxoacyl-[acyl-carrier-protein] reductase [Planctomycetaceae bacterium]